VHLMATSVEKSFKIVSYLVDHFSGRSIVDISANLDIHRSTAHRLLRVLERNNVVERTESRGKYRLGTLMLQIGSIALSDHGLCQISKPFLEELRNKSKETTYLSTYSGREVLYLDFKESIHGIAAMARPGMRLPPHCTPSGKIFLAFGPLDFRARVFRQHFKKYSKNTIINQDIMRKELKVVKSDGYAVCRNEYEDGITAMAVPIFTKGQSVVGAIGVAGPSTRLENIERFVADFKKSAGKISKVLGANAKLK